MPNVNNQNQTEAYGGASPYPSQTEERLGVGAARRYGMGKGAATPVTAPNKVVPPSTSPQGNSGQPRKRGAAFWIAVVVAVIAIAVAVLLALQMCEKQGSLRDPNQASGQLSGKTEAEIQAELDRVVEEGMFNISIASVVEFADGTSEGDLRIENVPGNRYLMQVDIVDDATGEVIYKSGIVEPNHHIQSAPLDVDLDAGQYECTATFHALSPEDETEVGQAAASVTVKVLG